jgi:aldehyde:ferredoxin oxidoreductase
MRLYEHGIITAKDTDGVPMEWGSAEAILPMAKKMSFRQGIGDLLAKGLPAAAEEIGRGSHELLFMAKGSPSDLHVPSVKTTVLAAAVSPIGEDLQVQPFIGYAGAGKYVRANDEAEFEESINKYRDRTEKELGSREAADPRITGGKAALVRQEEERADIIDMTGVCAWVTSFLGLPVNIPIIADFMSSGLGKPMDADTLKEAGRTMRHLERAFIGLCGLTREDDRLSKAYYDRIRPGGRLVPELCFTDEELERMKDDYYRLMEWDLKTGLPSRETLEKHGLTDVADRLGL